MIFLTFDMCFILLLECCCFFPSFEPEHSEDCLVHCYRWSDTWGEVQIFKEPIHWSSCIPSLPPHSSASAVFPAVLCPCQNKRIQHRHEISGGDSSSTTRWRTVLTDLQIERLFFCFSFCLAKFHSVFKKRGRKKEKDSLGDGAPCWSYCENLLRDR